MVFLIVLIAALLLQQILPWWIIVIVSFITCGILGKTAKISLWQPFLAILTLWTAMALYKSVPNDHLLATRIAAMFGLHFWGWVLIVTSLIGAFVSGVSGLCGYHFRKALLARKSKAKH